MRPIRYVGRHRNAGWGYPLTARIRREVAYWLAMRLGLYRLAYLVDFDRDRYLDEYGQGEDAGDWLGNLADELDLEAERLEVKR